MEYLERLTPFILDWEKSQLTRVNRNDKIKSKHNNFFIAFSLLVGVNFVILELTTRVGLCIIILYDKRGKVYAKSNTDLVKNDRGGRYERKEFDFS